jgi:hypothetical protein
VLQFTLTAGPAEGVTVASVTLHASGTGDDVNDLTSANLYLDNGTVKGAYDSGDTLLASGVYAADNGSCTYSVNRTLTASGAEDWLSVYTFSGGTTGATFAADITPGTDVSASGARRHHAGYGRERLGRPLLANRHGHGVADSGKHVYDWRHYRDLARLQGERHLALGPLGPLGRIRLHQ